MIYQIIKTTSLIIITNAKESEINFNIKHMLEDKLYKLHTNNKKEKNIILIKHYLTHDNI